MPILLLLLQILMLEGLWPWRTRIGRRRWPRRRRWSRTSRRGRLRIRIMSRMSRIRRRRRKSGKMERRGLQLSHNKANARDVRPVCESSWVKHLNFGNLNQLKIWTSEKNPLFSWVKGKRPKRNGQCLLRRPGRLNSNGMDFGCHHCDSPRLCRRAILHLVGSNHLICGFPRPFLGTQVVQCLQLGLGHMFW